MDVSGLLLEIKRLAGKYKIGLDGMARLAGEIMNLEKMAAPQFAAFCKSLNPEVNDAIHDTTGEIIDDREATDDWTDDDQQDEDDYFDELEEEDEEEDEL